MASEEQSASFAHKRTTPVNEQLDGGESEHVAAQAVEKAVTLHGGRVPVSDKCAQQRGADAGQSDGTEHSSVAFAAHVEEVHAFFTGEKVAQQTSLPVQWVDVPRAPHVGPTAASNGGLVPASASMGGWTTSGPASMGSTGASLDSASTASLASVPEDTLESSAGETSADDVASSDGRRVARTEESTRGSAASAQVSVHVW